MSIYSASGSVFVTAGGAAISSDQFAFRAPNGSDLYLNFSAGSDGTGTLASPWNTLTSLRLNTVAPGQALWVRQSSGAFPDVTSGNQSGTTTNRVTVSSYPGETGTFTFAAGGCRLGNGSYWDFRALGLSSQDTGICLGNNQAASGASPISNFCRFIDCVGTRSGTAYTDNQGIIYGQGGGVCIGHQIVRGSYSGPSGEANNQALLWFDFPSSLLIIGVLADQSSVPIYLKHTNQSTDASITIQNCIVRRGGRGMVCPANWVQLVNNAFDACTVNPSDEGGNTVDPGNNWSVTHNTYLNSDYQLDPSGTEQNANNTLLNNVWAGTSRFEDNPFGKQANLDMHNLSNYSACAGAGTNHYHRNGTQRTLSQQQAAFPTQEINGVAGTLTLVGGATPGSTPSNWALVGGSVGKNAASDGTDCGANANNLLTVNS